MVKEISPRMLRSNLLIDYGNNESSLSQMAICCCHGRAGKLVVLTQNLDPFVFHSTIVLDESFSNDPTLRIPDISSVSDKSDVTCSYDVPE